MKEILLKLANGKNVFNVIVFGQQTTGKIIQLDLWGLEEDKGRALIKLDKSVKKTITKELENNLFGMDSEHSYYENIEVDTYEEWVSINY